MVMAAVGTFIAAGAGVGGPSWLYGMAFARGKITQEGKTIALWSGVCRHVPRAKAMARKDDAAPALTSAPVAALWPATPAANTLELRFFGLPESEIAATLLELDQSGVEVTTCQRRSELEVDIRPRPGREDVAAKLHSELAARHAKQLVSADGSTTDELVSSTSRMFSFVTWMICSARRSRGTRSGFSVIPTVRWPWTFEWPRTGKMPAPGLPMLPRMSSKLLSIWIARTPERCCVRPMP